MSTSDYQPGDEIGVQWNTDAIRVRECTVVATVGEGVLVAPTTTEMTLYLKEGNVSTRWVDNDTFAAVGVFRRYSVRSDRILGMWDDVVADLEARGNKIQQKIMAALDDTTERCQAIKSRLGQLGIRGTEYGYRTRNGDAVNYSLPIDVLEQLLDRIEVK